MSCIAPYSGLIKPVTIVSDCTINIVIPIIDGSTIHNNIKPITHSVSSPCSFFILFNQNFLVNTVDIHSSPIINHAIELTTCCFTIILYICSAGCLSCSASETIVASILAEYLSTSFSTLESVT